jgi:hypothetical protein
LAAFEVITEGVRLIHYHGTVCCHGDHTVNESPRPAGQKGVDCTRNGSFVIKRFYDNDLFMH